MMPGSKSTPDENITINLICCTQVICNEIAQGVRRKDVALTYAMAIKSEAQGADKPDWKAINEAITAKWGFKGLDAVKNAARKHLGVGVR